LIHFAARDKEAFLGGQAKRVALPDRMVTDCSVVMGVATASVLGVAEPHMHGCRCMHGVILQLYSSPSYQQQQQKKGIRGREGLSTLGVLFLPCSTLLISWMEAGRLLRAHACDSVNCGCTCMRTHIIISSLGNGKDSDSLVQHYSLRSKL
jgi:hypothetical protein